MPPTQADLLFHAGGDCFERYGVACRRLAPRYRAGEELIETFTRADASTVASYVDRDGYLRRALANVLRVDWPLVSGVRQAHLLLEASRTNVILRSEELDNAAWASLGTPIVTANDAVAPDLTTTAEKIDDDDAVTNSERRNQNVAIANDTSPWCGSVFLRKATGRPVAGLNVQNTLGTAINKSIFVNPATGAFVIESGANGGVIDAAADYWRIWIAITNNGSGNTNAHCFVAPAARASGDLGAAAYDATATGYNHFWGFQLENSGFPSSYIKTVAAAVTRAADRLEFPFYAQPQAMTLYGHLLERAQPNWVSVAGGVPRIVQIGASNNAVPSLVLYKTSGSDGYVLDGSNASQTVSSTLDLNPVLGDRIELRALINADGSVQLHGAKNGGNESPASVSAANALASAWSAPPLVSVGCIGANGQGDINLRSLKIARGIWGMQEMRDL